MAISHLRSFILIVLGAALAACAGAPVRPPAPAIDEGRELVALLAARARQAPLAAKATVRMTAPQKQSANLAFVVSPPDRLRLEASTLFGINLAVVAADPARITAFVYGENRYFMGPATSPAARSLFFVPLAPREFVALVTGVPSLEGYSLLPGSFRGGEHAYGAKFRGAHDGRILTVVVNRESSTVRELIYELPTRTLRIAFERWRDTGAGPLPEHVVVTGGEQLHAEVDLGSWDLSARPAEADFRIPPPPGSAIYLLDTGATRE